jgi:hypothetical protein
MVYKPHQIPLFIFSTSNSPVTRYAGPGRRHTRISICTLTNWNPTKHAGSRTPSDRHGFVFLVFFCSSQLHTVDPLWPNPAPRRSRLYVGLGLSSTFTFISRLSYVLVRGWAEARRPAPVFHMLTFVLREHHLVFTPRRNRIC